MTNCGIMGVVVFVTFYGTSVEIMFVDELKYLKYIIMVVRSRVRLKATKWNEIAVWDSSMKAAELLLTTSGSSSHVEEDEFILRFCYNAADRTHNILKLKKNKREIKSVWHH